MLFHSFNHSSFIIIIVVETTPTTKTTPTHIIKVKMLAAFIVLPLVMGFNVKLVCQIDHDKPILDLYFDGKEENVVTELERITFGITDDKIKECIRIYLGERPDDVFVRSPTPWDDLYSLYRWKQVEKSLVAKRGKIVRITSQPVNFSRRILENKTPKPANVSILVSDTAEVAFTSLWIDLKKLSMRQNISYDIEIETSDTISRYAFMSIWGKNGESIQTVRVGSPEPLQVVLNAAQIAQAQLMATKGFMNIEIQYEASVRGNLVVNFGETYTGHHFWGPRIENVLDTCNVNKTLIFTEVVCLCYYVNPKIVVSDLKNGKLIKEFNVGATFLHDIL